MANVWGPPGLIALDIDGTIMNGFRSVSELASEPMSTGRPRAASPSLRGGVVSERVLAGVRNAVAGGAHVVLATGRPVISTLPVLTQLGLSTGSAICSNGAVRVDVASGDFLAVHRFDAAPVVERLRPLLPGALFAIEQPGAENLVTGPFPGSELAADRVVDLVTLVAQPVTRLTVWWVDHTAAELAAQVAAARLVGVAYTVDRVAPCMVAVPVGVSKGSALEALRLELKVAADFTLAVGDGDNDLEMLRWAACGVAMGQAPDIVKAAAVEVTGSIDDDGLASILERWY